MRGLAFAVAVAVIASYTSCDAFSFEMEITTGPDGQHVNIMHGGPHGDEAKHDEYGFLSKVRQQMNHLAKASQDVFHKSPLEGLFDDISHIFDDRHGNDPFASLHEVAHRTRTESGEKELHHEDFKNAAMRGHKSMLAIMDMMRQMARPLLEEHHVPLQVGPPRGLVALACHKDAIQYCQQYCSCWKGMTQCLAQHAEQIQPRCHHLLEASGINLSEEKPEEKPEVTPVAEEEDEDEEKQEQKQTEKKAVKALGEAKVLAKIPPSLSMKNSLQQLHDALETDIANARQAMKKDKEEPVEVPEPEMSEGTPAYLMGDVEKPLGEKDMGGWTMRVYTDEQQARLNVDEQGQAVKTKTKTKVKKTVVKAESKKPVEKASVFADYIEQVKIDVKRVPMWAVWMLSLLCVLLSLIAFFYGRMRRRRAEALAGLYTTITMPAADEQMRTLVGSEDQI